MRAWPPAAWKRGNRTWVMSRGGPARVGTGNRRIHLAAGVTRLRLCRPLQPMRSVPVKRRTTRCPARQVQPARRQWQRRRFCGPSKRAVSGRMPLARPAHRECSTNSVKVVIAPTRRPESTCWIKDRFRPARSITPSTLRRCRVSSAPTRWVPPAKGTRCVVRSASRLSASASVVGL